MICYTPQRGRLDNLYAEMSTVLINIEATNGDAESCKDPLPVKLHPINRMLFNTDMMNPVED